MFLDFLFGGGAAAGDEGLDLLVPGGVQLRFPLRSHEKFSEIQKERAKFRKNERESLREF